MAVVSVVQGEIKDRIAVKVKDGVNVNVILRVQVRGKVRIFVVREKNRQRWLMTVK